MSGATRSNARQKKANRCCGALSPFFSGPYRSSLCEVDSRPGLRAVALEVASVRALLILLALTIALATQTEDPVVSVVLIPFVVTLLAAHLDREGGRLSRAVIIAAARLLPAGKRENECDEWLDHVAAAGERGVVPLSRALSIALLAAPLLAIGLRVGRPRRVPR